MAWCAMDHMTTLTLREFVTQLQNCRVPVLDYEPEETGIEQVIIRGEHGDFSLAACHREGTRLILDLGQPIKE